MKAEGVLVHVCCAHCSAYTLQFWQRQGYRAAAFWFNPNIHPAEEHELRLEAIKELSHEMQVPLHVFPGYDADIYFSRIGQDRAERCLLCFELRLEQTAREARKRAYGAFSTSLLISPHQQHEGLMIMGHEIARKTGLVFLYSDLRRRYSDSRVMTKNRHYYRQHYCGCMYSRDESRKAR